MSKKTLMYQHVREQNFIVMTHVCKMTLKLGTSINVSNLTIMFVSSQNRS